MGPDWRRPEVLAIGFGCHALTCGTVRAEKCKAASYYPKCLFEHETSGTSSGPESHGCATPNRAVCDRSIGSHRGSLTSNLLSFPPVHD